MFSATRPRRRRAIHGYTLVEAMVVLAMITLLVLMANISYKHVIKRAKQTASKKKVKVIGLALANCLTANENGWPNPPEDVDDNTSAEEETDVKLDEWWYFALKDHGMDNPEDWVSPFDMDGFKRLQKEQGLKYFSSYNITPFQGKAEPYKYNQPWVSEKMPVDGVVVVYLPDGRVAEMDSISFGIK
jgi:type II secretory pathway pseudopilin PulG